MIEGDKQWEFRKKMSHHLILSTKGGGRYQGVDTADKAMVAFGPNRLLGYGRVSDLCGFLHRRGTVITF